MREIGLDVGHEFLGENGTSNWHVATSLRNPSRVETIEGMTFDLRIHQVRHPLDAYESILRFIVPHSIFGWSLKCIFQDLGVNLRGINDSRELAFGYWLYWNLMVEQNIRPQVRFRVEEGHYALYQLLARYFHVTPPNRIVESHFNTGFREKTSQRSTAKVRHDATLAKTLDSAEEFKRISASLRYQIRVKSHAYGYAIP
ncbi:hypothetical protein [Roseiconus lacunae]|uniref:hypothetical protein n=1 Tax=Roseiconus lacunae TaxID=2605694 RepID=UPI001E3AFD8B|nr:hypothetical protein [Roseiconus lacunae]MCD0458686.1 hypothetical protein [Roseiconus lacunae]